MSSTSSSDCENCDYCQCYALDNNYDNYVYSQPIGNSRHAPYVSTMGHPLVYYAQVINRGYKILETLYNEQSYRIRQYLPDNFKTDWYRKYKLTRQRPLNRRQKCGQYRKENQNCFVKAFKWYTQERVPDQKKDGSPERNGFANWLDVKYFEYLQDSQLKQVYQLSTQQTTTLDPCPDCPSPYEPCTTKRFSRVKSPWRKRRRACKDSGDVAEKNNNQSCEFIMQPKDLNRAASDCCYPTPTSGCNKSNATVVSSNVPGAMKCMGKSHSLSSVCRETSVQQHIDIIPCNAQEGSNTKQPVKKVVPCREQILQVPSKSRKVDVACQCPEERVVPVNAQTQYESTTGKSSHVEVHTPCCKCLPGAGYPPTPVKSRSRKLSIPEIQPPRVPSTQKYKYEKKSKKQQRPVSCQCPEENIVKVDTHCQYQPDSECWCDDAARKVCAPNRLKDFPETKQLNTPKPNSDRLCNNTTSNRDVPETKQASIPKPYSECGCNNTAPNQDVPETKPGNAPKPNSECWCNNTEPNRDVPETKPVNAPKPNSECWCNNTAPNRDIPETKPVLAPKIIQRQSVTTVVVSKRAEKCGCMVQDEATDVKEMKQVLSSKSVRGQSCSTVNEPIATCKCKVKEVSSASKLARSVTCTRICVADENAQTSDHSICLETDKYPLFLKIVCAERL